MLKTKEEGQDHGHAVVQAEKGRNAARFFEKRNIRPEQECVVILANQSLSVSPALVAFIPK
jgi:hypothetical protein